MLRIACISFNDTIINNLSDSHINVNYYNSLKTIDLALYKIIIILNDLGNVDIIRALTIIRKDYTGLIYVIDRNYNPKIALTTLSFDVPYYSSFPIDIDYFREKIIYDFKKHVKQIDYVYKYKELTIDFNKNQITISNETISLSYKETLLLRILVENKNMKISKKELMIEVWHYNDDIRTLETHIKTLRNKLKEYRSLIITIWAYGYMFIDDETN